MQLGSTKTADLVITSISVERASIFLFFAMFDCCVVLSCYVLESKSRGGGNFEIICKVVAVTCETHLISNVGSELASRRK